MIVHVILCLNEREIQKKEKEKERKIIHQENQISKLTFNFLEHFQSQLFLKMNSPYSPRKKEKKKRKKRKKN